MNENERNESKEYFSRKTNIEDITMCVDGTHIKIKKPLHRPLLYLNRKHCYSLNVMLVCDHKYRIRAINARFPGSNHDAHVWKVKLFVTGDAGYPSEPWLIRPHRNPGRGSEEASFNTLLSSGRIIVEMTIAILKSRFRCLNGGDGCLNYTPKKCAAIINVCRALHNVCIEHNIEGQQVFDDIMLSAQAT
uniref:DDE Tnp4 domain-containing protein n=1 Tax=Anopheles funestus TaxID=62324 RepID=A0A182RZA5_ANOFN